MSDDLITDENEMLNIIETIEVIYNHIMLILDTLYVKLIPLLLKDKTVSKNYKQNKQNIVKISKLIESLL